MKEFKLEDNFDQQPGKIDYKEELNDEQYDVVMNGDGACLVLAGAGSGKTRTITYRVAYLLENGVAPQNILLLTFTNKAAREMMTRVERLTGVSPNGLWGGTFHSIANRILRRHPKLVSRSPNFTILDTEDSKSLIKLCIKDLDIDTKERRFPKPGQLFGMISYSRNSGRSLEAVVEERHENYFEVLPMIEKVAEEYASRKLQSDAMDFDDLLILLREMLTDNPEIRDQLSSQFRYILVDEYQDTNAIQADIVRLLSSVHKNVLVVGDDAQSIYSFRAADIKNILNFPDIYPSVKTFRLTTNYRSTPEVLDVANAVINNNTRQFEKELEAVNESFELPNVVPTSNQRQEAKYIVEQILELRDEGVDLSDLAVLFRASFHAQTLEFELMKRDVPYDFRGGLKFFERAHIKDVVSHLRLLTNPKDEMAWMRVLTLQKGVGTVTAGRLIDKLRAFDDVEVIVDAPLEPPSRAASGWQELTGRLGEMAENRERPSEVIRAILARGYRAHVEDQYDNARERLDDLEQFALFAESYDGMKKFLDEISLATDYGALRQKGANTEDERMVLSTIHQAKGLEWDSVFVMNLTKDKFPNKRALNEDGGLEEERRLFYVAVTRAKNRLFLTYPTTSGYDSLAVNQPSSFLKEVPDDLLEEVRLSYGGRSGGYRNNYKRKNNWRKKKKKNDTVWSSDGEATIQVDENGEYVSDTSSDDGSASGLLRDVNNL